jgi:hypothetical protein
VHAEATGQLDSDASGRRFGRDFHNDTHRLPLAAATFDVTLRQAQGDSGRLALKIPRDKKTGWIWSVWQTMRPFESGVLFWRNGNHG